MDEPTITDADGKGYRPGQADYEAVRFANLERIQRELMREVADLQHRVSELDGKDIEWPASEIEPRSAD